MHGKQLVAILLAIVMLVSFAVPSFASLVVDGSEKSGIRSWFSDIAGFFGKLFVPEANYFQNKLADLSDYTNKRLGGVGVLYQMLNDFFKRLKNVPTTNLQFRLPDGFFFRGYRGLSVDLLSSAKPYISLLHNVFTAAACLLTAIICYHKVRTFFTENE